jgi:hypothetical protein
MSIYRDAMVSSQQAAPISQVRKPRPPVSLIIPAMTLPASSSR